MESIEKVIAGGYCVGCGICSSLKEQPYKMSIDDNGRYQAFQNLEKIEYNNLASKTCPFSDDSLNEDEIGDKYFKNINKIKKDNVIGYHLNLYAGNIKEDTFRESGSSGGGVSWLLKELFERDLIDGVIHVKNSSEENLIFEYGISESVEEMRTGAKSRYYPVELSKAISHIREQSKGKRYAVVGIPCFIKGLRNLANNDDDINEKIKFYIGIVCGHLKSKNFASLFAWQNGIHPDNLINIDFRHKVKSNDAALYRVKLTYKDKRGKERVKITKTASELYGTDWGLGFFKYKACDYCDDIFAETADVVFGDAWVPGYREDWRGDNVVVVRNERINHIIKEGIDGTKVNFNNVDKELILKTQSGSIRHRRRGLAYRLRKNLELNTWVPKKRVEPLPHDEKQKYKKIQNYRMWFVENGDKLFKQALDRNSFFFFKKKLFLRIMKYKFLVYGLKGILPSKIKDLYRQFFKEKKG